MGRWVQDRLLFVLCAALVAIVATSVLWTAWEPTANRSDVFALLTILLGLVAAVAAVAALRGRRQTEPRSVPVLADSLADAVSGQWRMAAMQRRLLTPEPIPVRWSLSTLPVTGPMEAAVGTADRSPAFAPLPSFPRITAEDLRAGGGRGELHALYAGLGSGRIVVVGAVGAGKSGAAILLLLDALAHRDRLDTSERARVPVPVLFTVYGWDPHTTSVQTWLCEQLLATYPLFQGRGGAAEAVALVTARDTITLLLDGLDEMDTALRPVALQALNDAPFRVVVLTRSAEMVQAAATAWLVGAVAVHLHDVPAADAADYLQRARSGPAPGRWAELLSQLREYPDGVLAQGLSTPLTLTLLRDTYQPGDDVGEVLHPTRYPTRDALQRHLIARVLPAAYRPRPGRPPPRYSEAQARQALSCIARKMGTDPNLAWWQIPSWTPAIPRILTTAFVAGLPFGLLFGLVAELAGGLGAGLGVGLGGGLVGGLAYGRGGREPQRLKMANWRSARSRQVLGIALLVGLTVGLAYSLTVGLGFGAGLVLGFGFVGGLMGLMSVLIEHGAREGSPLGPREIWRNDRIAGLAVGLAFGLTPGLVVGLEVGRTGELMVGLAVGLVVGLTFWLVGGLIFPAIWPTTLAWLQLRLAGQVSAVRLMPFLEDAREREVLRTVGGVYHFRHAMLQDQLAEQAALDRTVTPAA